MLFMNTWEIDERADRFKSHPVLGKATRFLQRFRDLIDRNSDGWAYWPLPVRAAKSLQELIQNPDTATEAAYKKAIRPIKAFCTRHKLTFPESDTPGMTVEERILRLDAAMGPLCEIANARKDETRNGPTDKMQKWEMEREYGAYKIRVICEYK